MVKSTIMQPELQDAGQGGLYFAASASFLCLFVGGLWWSCTVVAAESLQRKQNLQRDDVKAYYASRRQLLFNMKVYRALELLASFAYVVVLIWVYIVKNLSSLDSSQAFGLMLAFFSMASSCWSLTITLVPYFAPLLAEYNSIVSAVMHVLDVIHTNLSIYTGLAFGKPFYDKVLISDLIWLLSGVSIEAYLPVHFVGVTLYAAVHLDNERKLLQDVWGLSWLLLSYLALGLAVPFLLQTLLSSQSQTKIPAPFCHVSSAFVVVYQFFDMILRIPKIAEPLHQNYPSSPVLQAFALLVHPQSVLAQSYGVPVSVGVTFLTVCLILLVLCSLVMLLAEEDPRSHHSASPLYQAMVKRPTFALAVGFLRSLTIGKKYIVCVMVCISGLQLFGVASIVVRLLLFGGNSLLVAAPLILLSIMLGVVIEVFGVLYIVTPSPVTRRGVDCDSGSVKSWRSTVSLPSRSTALSLHKHEAPDSTDYSQLYSGVSYSSGSMYPENINRDCDTVDFHSRIEALANFKTFMLGLDSQPGVYTLEDFMKGAANAMKGIYPGVHHASFCLLNSGRVSVNMYTFIGEGSNKPPRMSVAVAPGTLIYYVLNKCQPVFISNIVTFPGPYSDVQFMRFVLGLKSVACLPLVVSGSRLLGVLRLGFEEAWQWEEQEKNLAKQLALVLSSSSQSLKPPPEYDDSRSANTSDMYRGGSSGSDHGQEAQLAGAYPPHAPASMGRGPRSGSHHNSPLGRRTGPDLANSGSWELDEQVGDRLQNSMVQSKTQDIKMLEIIGRGGFGSVYKAFWRGQIVAVKVLEHGDDFMGCSETGKNDNQDTTGRRAALLEGAMTSTINHPNVVQTFDYRVVHLHPTPLSPGISGHTRVLQETHIIMEFCDRGSLQDAIEQGAFLVDGPNGARVPGKVPEVDMEAILLTLNEVASALDYLHGHRLTHRDLKPKNILLKSKVKDKRGFTAKVSDFGLSQVLPDTQETHVSTKYSGTVTHMPPELIEDGKIYQTGDVYAFGIIMWEMYSGKIPYANMAHPQIMVGVVTHNLRPKYPDACPDWYKSLSYRCWKKDAKSRPSFSEICTFLDQGLRDRVWAR